MTQPAQSGFDDAAARPSGNAIGRLHAAYAEFADRLTLYLGDIGLLVLRLPVAYIFWRSGRTKVEGWNIFQITPSQPFLFEHEFGMPFPVLSAHLAAIGEHVLPVLLVLGLFTRLGAAGLIAMTLVIQLMVFPTMDHWLNVAMYWLAILCAVLALGPGRISLDHWLGLDRRA